MAFYAIGELDERPDFCSVVEGTALAVRCRGCHSLWLLSLRQVRESNPPLGGKPRILLTIKLPSSYLLPEGEGTKIYLDEMLSSNRSLSCIPALRDTRTSCPSHLFRRYGKLKEHLIQSLNKPRRILKGTPFTQQRLIKQQITPFLDLGFILLRFQLSHQRMRRVDFHDWFRCRGVLTHGFQDAIHVHTHVVFIRHQAGRGIGQAMGDAHLFDFITECLLNSFVDVFKFFFGSFLFFFFLFVFGITEIKLTLGHRL